MRPIDQGFIAHEDLIDVARSWLLPNANGSGACAVPFEAILMAAVAAVQVLLFTLGAAGARCSRSRGAGSKNLTDAPAYRVQRHHVPDAGSIIASRRRSPEGRAGIDCRCRKSDGANSDQMPTAMIC
jgi:hypothetical protein